MNAKEALEMGADLLHGKPGAWGTSTERDAAAFIRDRLIPFVEAAMALAEERITMDLEWTTCGDCFDAAYRAMKEGK